MKKNKHLLFTILLVVCILVACDSYNVHSCPMVIKSFIMQNPDSACEQTGYIVTLLTSLLTGGVLMLLFEMLHINTMLTNRFYGKIQPFLFHLTSYVRFVGWFRNDMQYIEEEQEYVKELKKMIKEICSYDTLDIISGKNLRLSQFTAQQLENLCECINKVWYLMSEKYNYVIPNISFDPNRHNEMFIRKSLEGIKDEYKNVNIDLFLLAKVSGEFYTDIYMAVESVFYEYEYWIKLMKSLKQLSFTILTLILVSILLISFAGTCICFGVYVTLAIIDCIAFCYLLWRTIVGYNKSSGLLK